jgi:SAM-dependent methyltransferase
VTDLNPQAKQMADQSMVRGLDAQARAIWPQEVHFIRRYAIPADARILDAGCGTGEGCSRLAELFPQAQVLGVDISDEHLELARSRYADLAGDCGWSGRVYSSSAFQTIVLILRLAVTSCIRFLPPIACWRS